MTDILDLATSAGSLMVDRVLKKALALDASDVHMETGVGGFSLRFRRDGLLHLETQLTATIGPHYEAVVSRLKVMAGLDIAERRLPQDGRIQWQHGDRKADIRLSLVPVLGGERVVMRLLYGAAEELQLPSLGMPAPTLRLFEAELKRTQGLILVTGPTGSGKSTTLYSAMQVLRSPERCVLSVEDPVERAVDGIGQVQVQSAIGLDFSRVLRALLRQDPEVLIVGEMRDGETAQIAVRASLTGHMVLSTLHAGSCLSSIARLRDMGLDGWLLGASLRLIVAQRLVRLLCRHCREPDRAGSSFAVRQGWLEEGAGVNRAHGCEACLGSGYAGRVGLFEVLPVRPALSAAMARGGGEDELAKAAGAFSDLHSEGLRLLGEGAIGMAEFQRVLG